MFAESCRQVVILLFAINSEVDDLSCLLSNSGEPHED